MDIEREKQIEAASKASRPTYKTPSVEALRALGAEHEGWFADIVETLGEVTVVVPREQIVAVCAHLKTTQGLEFNMLSDLCGVDRGPEEEPRFEVNYHLFSTTIHHRLRLKVLLNEDDPHVPSVTAVLRTANWHERETFDMFGVVSDGHPDLRRILLPDEWQGHALRKDFPLRGYEPYSLT
ncbi:MAG TPA: NADH-quinone oxidoreductase subunit C [Pyrinomonadaceae bacterium]